MLVLSRKLLQRIYIGENIVVTILGTNGERVKVGIEAPPEVNVRREELRKFTPHQLSIRSNANVSSPGGTCPT